MSNEHITSKPATESTTTQYVYTVVKTFTITEYDNNGNMIKEIEYMSKNTENIEGNEKNVDKIKEYSKGGCTINTYNNNTIVTETYDENGNFIEKSVDYGVFEGMTYKSCE